MNFFPEMRGSTLVSCDDDGTITETPIIGWAYVQGVRVDPVFCVARRSGVGPNEGIRIVNELGAAVVCSPHLRQTYTEEEWHERMAEMAEKGEFDNLEEGSEKSPAASTKAAPSEPTGDPINFDNDAYKTKSYWVMPAERALFQIEKNMTHPADKRCEKITRDEFASFKRDGFKVIDPHAFGAEPDEPTPEELAAAINEEADDGFDASDLV